MTRDMRCTMPHSGRPRCLRLHVHALGYLVVTAAVAFLVFEKLGVGILRKAWFN